MSTPRYVPDGYIIGRLWKTGGYKSSPASGGSVKPLLVPTQRALLAPTPSPAGTIKRLSRQLSDLYGQFNWQTQTIAIIAHTSTLLLPADPLRVYQRLYVTGTARNQATGIAISTNPLTAATDGLDLGGHPIQDGMMYANYALDVQQALYYYSTAAGTPNLILTTIRAQQ